MSDPLLRFSEGAVARPSPSDSLLEAQRDVLEMIVQGRPLREVLDALCLIVETQAARTVKAAILQLDASGQHLFTAAAPNLPIAYSQAIDGIAISPTVGTCAAAAARQQRVLTSDISSDPSWSGLSHLPLALGLKAAWSMPIVSSGGAVLGTFGTYFPEIREPSPHEQRLVEMLARTAALAFERQKSDALLIASGKRDRFLAELSAATQVLSEPTAIMSATARLLAEYLEVDRCAYAEVENESVFVITGDHPRGVPSIVGRWDVAAFGTACVKKMLAGEAFIVHDTETDPQVTPEDKAAFNAATIRAVICVPLLKEGRFTAAMAVHQIVPRRWTESELELVRLVVARCWEALERSRVTRTLQESASNLALLNERLREQDRRKDEFLATLAHELRNPLAPIRTGLEILRAGAPNEQAIKIREMMQRQLQHLVRMVDDLLDVSRVTLGKVSLKKERMDFRSVLHSALETTRPLIEARNHELAVRLPQDAFPLDVDHTRMTQVVANIVGNAAKYTPPGGRIQLTAETDRQTFVLKVSDSGVGIPNEMLPRIFDLFTQVRRTGSDGVQDGLGLGLTLVRRLVEMHEGTVEADSPGLGKGSTFTVRLPLARAERAAPAPVSAAEDKSVKGPSLRVLVVDDNADAAETLAMLLGLDGHETQIVHSGEAALAAVADFHPDIAFVDIGLPDLTGYEVAHRLRADEAIPKSLLLVALTGWGMEEDRRQAYSAGFDVHLVKPVDLAKLNDVLKGHFKQPA